MYKLSYNGYFIKESSSLDDLLCLFSFEQRELEKRGIERKGKLIIKLKNKIIKKW